MRNLIWLLLVVNIYAFAAVNNTGARIDWSYKGNTGPSWWGKLDPDFILCSTGKNQSPINIPKEVQVVNKPLDIKYQPANLYMMDNGLTTLTISGTQTIYNDGRAVQVTFADNNHEILIYNKITYRLVQFHFHTPSETRIHSLSTPLEVHFVLQAPQGKVAVVAVMIESGEANPEIQKIVNHLPVVEGIEHEIKGEKIDPSGLIPENRSYYSFAGSLTTPPCTEGLQWIVMANKITASPAQILKLRNEMGNNARPIQKLHDRIVSYSRV